MHSFPSCFPFSLLRRLVPALVLVSLVGPACREDAGAQELPFLSPGQLRLDFAPRFWSWNSRFGLRVEDGKTIEEVESLGSDLTADPLGREVMPHLQGLETHLEEALGASGFRARLGVSRAEVDQARLVFPFRAELGITDWLTLGATVPFIRPRTEITFALDADSSSANVGLSPQLTQTGSVSQFLSAFQQAIDEARTSSPDDPVLGEAQGYLDALSAAYGVGTVFPMAGSPAGLGLQARLDSLGGALDELGATTVPSSVPLAQNYLDEESFRSLLASSTMLAFPLEDFTTPWTLGDVEISAALRLLRGGFEPDSAGDLPTVRYQLGAGLLLRLGTGSEDDPDRFLDLRTGDGQRDLEASVFGLLQLGDRLGAWGRVRYGIQQEGERLQRIATHTQALPSRARLAPLLWTPGNYLELELNPRLQLTEAMAVGFRYHLWSKGRDSYEIQPGAPEDLLPGYPPTDLLEEETEQTLHEAGVSVVYSTLEAHRRGEASLPAHIRFTFFHPLAGSGGRTPRGGRMEAGLSLYRGLWGG
jgi:hypothetical protein